MLTAIHRLLGVKGNRIYLSGGVPSAGSGTVGVEAENLLLSFIARPVMSFVVLCCIIDVGTRRISDGCSLCGNLIAYEALSRAKISTQANLKPFTTWWPLT